MSGEQTGDGTTTDNSVASTEDNKSGEKTFTQADLDRIVSKRVNKMKTEISDLSSKAELLDNMMADEKFRAWLEGEAEGGKNKKASDSNSQDLDLSAELTKQDPELGPTIINFVKEAVADALGLVKSEVDDLKTVTIKEKADKAVSDMFQAVDEDGNLKYPWMQDQTFTKEMGDLLDAQRVQTLEDAYDLAALGRQRNNQEPPGVNTKKVSDAVLLESDEGGGEGGVRSDSNSNSTDPKVFKSFEECFNSVAKTRNWYKK